MLFKEFVEETRKIERFYGKELIEEQQKIWFENLKKMGVDRYKYLIGEIYRRNKFFPTLADIVQLDDDLGFKRAEEKTRKIVKCNICNGRGVIRYSKKIEYMNYEFVCKCNCQNAIEYKSFPSMNEIGLNEEMILRARQSNKNNMTMEQAKKIIKDFMRTGKIKIGGV